MQVLYLRFIERFGKGIRTAPRDSLIAGSVTNGETGKSFGLQKAMDNSGAIMGPLAAFILLIYFPKQLSAYIRAVRNTCNPKYFCDNFWNKRRYKKQGKPV